MKAFQDLVDKRSFTHLAWTGQDLHETTGLLQTFKENLISGSLVHGFALSFGAYLEFTSYYS
jgi:hypothetical protein